MRVICSEGAIGAVLGGATSTVGCTHGAQDRLTSAGTETYSNDGNDNITAAVSASGPTTYTYGAVPNELQAVTWTDGSTTTYGYDAHGNTSGSV